VRERERERERERKKERKHPHFEIQYYSMQAESTAPLLAARSNQYYQLR
jgi:hypothetical protein